MVTTLKYRAGGGGVLIVQDMPDMGRNAYALQFDKQSLVPDCIKGFLHI